MKIKKQEKQAKTASRNFVIALSIVSILGFLSIIINSFFYLDLSGYIETGLLVVLGTGLILETSINEFKKIKKKGLTSEMLGKVTMVVVGALSIIAGLLSLPQLNLQSPSLLAIKGIISILAVIFIITQTWVTN